ncbi:MAG TPA: hypothetical protein VHN58_09795 [Croceicoccus sp.]|nr:hypothetical protein [Croceicoccus sp.]
MIGRILDAITGLSRSARLALIIAAGIVAIVVGLRLHDRQVVTAHDAKAAAASAQATIRADRAAIAADAVREAQRQADSAETKEAIDHAEQENPEDVRRPAGPAVRAAADSLRRRAAASRNAAP